jgi:hypothetical protein
MKMLLIRAVAVASLLAMSAPAHAMGLGWFWW